MSLLGIIASSKSKGGLPVANASLWLDAADSTVFTYSSGTVVSQWTDKSTNAYQFTNSSTSAQPSRSGTQNSKSTVVFDGSNDTLYESNKSKSLFNYLHNGDKATVFITKKLTSTAAVELYVMGTCTEAGGTQRGFFAGGHYPPTANIYAGIGTGTSGSYAFNDTSTTNNTWEIRTYKSDPNNATSGDKLPSFLDLGSKISGTSANLTTASTANASGWLGIGAVNDGTNIRYYFNGEIAEIIIYPSLLSDSDKDLVINYLKTKWSI